MLPLQRFFWAVLLVIGFSACQQPLGLPGTLPPNPSNLAASPRVVFQARVSTAFAGMVRFINNSEGMERFHWNFGYLQGGEPAVSQEPSPTVFYLRNGVYLVQLIGTDADGKEYQFSRQITITNVP